MTRPLRIEYEDAVYHVMNRGLARQNVFLDDVDYQKFLKTLEESYHRWKVQIYAYALMDNHYHLCLQTPRGNLSRVMRHIDGIYTQHFNRAHHRDGPLFRGRYKAILIEEEKYLGVVVRYIHLNPVKAKIIEDPRKYQWSSHKDYINKKNKSAWLATDKLLESFGGSFEFHTYVMEGNDQAVEKFYSGRKQKPVLGTDAFIEEVREKVGEPHKENIREERKYLLPKIENLIKQVGASYSVNRNRIEYGIRGKENEARRVAMYLAHHACDLTYEEIAEIFHLTNYGTVGWCCSKVRNDMMENKNLQKRVKNIQNEI